jgi:hypothetical protein
MYRKSNSYNSSPLFFAARITAVSTAHCFCRKSEINFLSQLRYAARAQEEIYCFSVLLQERQLLNRC